MSEHREITSTKVTLLTVASHSLLVKGSSCSQVLLLVDSLTWSPNPPASGESSSPSLHTEVFHFSCGNWTKYGLLKLCAPLFLSQKTSFHFKEREFSWEPLDSIWLWWQWKEKGNSSVWLTKLSPSVGYTSRDLTENWRPLREPVRICYCSGDQIWSLHLRRPSGSVRAYFPGLSEKSLCLEAKNTGLLGVGDWVHT